MASNLNWKEWMQQLAISKAPHVRLTTDLAFILLVWLWLSMFKNVATMPVHIKFDCRRPFLQTSANFWIHTINTVDYKLVLKLKWNLPTFFAFKNLQITKKPMTHTPVQWRWPNVGNPQSRGDSTCSGKNGSVFYLLNRWSWLTTDRHIHSRV